MIVDNGEIKWLGEEEGKSDDFTSDPYEVTKPSSVLKQLYDMNYEQQR